MEITRKRKRIKKENRRELMFHKNSTWISIGLRMKITVNIYLSNYLIGLFSGMPGRRGYLSGVGETLSIITR
jgi:hypothetical protein